MPQAHRLSEQLMREMNWLSALIAAQPSGLAELQSAAAQSPMPDLEVAAGDAYAELIQGKNFSVPERLALLLAAVPHVDPQLLAPLCTPDLLRLSGGGLDKRLAYQPTGQTLAWLLSGLKPGQRLQTLALFSETHAFHTENLLTLEGVERGEPFLNGTLLAGTALLDRVLYGEERAPRFSQEFPAKRIATGMQWDDLVLAESTRRELDEIRVWMEHGETLMREWNAGHKFKQGYRSLFFGPSGTGKTLTACLLAKSAGREVFRIDLSMVVSKYIGETEKNLGKIFDRAEHQNWILFFDEADALFGKRTNVSDAHDRYANQEVSFLLQRIEDYNGVVILASNFKSNMDDAFTRRFQSMIYFPLPKADERLMLWQKNLPEGLALEENIKLADLANRYELSGGSINGICRYVSLMAIDKGKQTIYYADIIEGIRREMEKQGRIM